MSVFVPSGKTSFHFLFFYPLGFFYGGDAVRGGLLLSPKAKEAPKASALLIQLLG
jgi:hypothetical protein